MRRRLSPVPGADNSGLPHAKTYCKTMVCSADRTGSTVSVVVSVGSSSRCAAVRLLEGFGLCGNSRKPRDYWYFAGWCAVVRFGSGLRKSALNALRGQCPNP